MQTISQLRATVAAALVAVGGQVVAADAKVSPLAPKPEVSIRYGNTFGVAPTLTLPLRNDGKVEVKGPDLHPQVQPSLNGGSVTVTVPWPEGKKK